MDKVKSRFDLRAAGKKRLEEYRQKRQQKGSSSKPVTAITFKALTESEQVSGEHHLIDGTVTSDVYPSEELQRASSENSGTAECDSRSKSVAANAYEALKAHEEEEVHGSHVSDGNLEGSQTGREAVYTILYESHGTDPPQRNEAWQESTHEGGINLDERALDQGNLSSFRVDDERFGSETKEGSSTQRTPSGALHHAAEDFRRVAMASCLRAFFVQIRQKSERRVWISDEESAVKDATARNEESPSTASTQQTPLQDAMGDGGRTDGSSAQSGIKAQPAVKEEGERAEKRILSERDGTLEREKAQVVAELVILLQKLESILKETGDYRLEALESVKSQLEQEFQSALQKADREKQQFIVECEDWRTQRRRMVEERNQFLGQMDVYEEELGTLRADATRLADEMKNMVDEKTQLARDLCTVREQVSGATKLETLLKSELTGLKEERESELSRFRELHEQLRDLVEENSQLQARCIEYVEVLEGLRVVNQKLVDDIAESGKEKQRWDAQIATERKSWTDHVVTMEEEKLNLHAVVEKLTQRLHIHEEERKDAWKVVEFEEHSSKVTDERLEVARQLDFWKQEAARLDGEKAELEKSAASAMEALERKVRILGAEIVELEEQVNTAREGLQQSNDKAMRLDADNTDTETNFGVAVETLKQSLRTLEDEKLDLEKQVEELVEEKVHLTDQLVVSEQSLKKMSEEKMQLESEGRSLLQRAKGLEGERELMTNQLEVSQDSLQKLSEEKTRVESELHASLQKLKQLTEERDALSLDLQLMQRALQRVGEEKADVEAELEGSFAKLKDALELKDQMCGKLEVLLQSESENTAKAQELGSKLVSLHKLAEENCRLEAELKEVEQQLAGYQVQKNYQVLEEARSPTLERGREELVLVDSEGVSPTSHAASRLVKKLVKVFEGRASEDVPDRHPRGPTSPVTELFNQARAMKETADVLQQERDAAIQAELATRADLEAVSKKLNFATEERVTLQASVKELEANLATAMADYNSLKQTAEEVRRADEERVNLVALFKQSQKDYSVLEAENHKLAEELVIAQRRSDAMAENPALMDLQRRFEEVETILKTEKDASENLKSRVGLLVSFIEGSLSPNFHDIIHTCEPACDVVSQVENGLRIMIEEVLPMLSVKVKALEEESDTARMAVHGQHKKNETMREEKEALILEMEAMRVEMDRKVANEAKARAEYERDIESLTCKLQDVQNELHKFKHDYMGFEKKLELAVHQDCSNCEVKPPGGVESSFEFCWTLVDLMLEGSSKKLLDVQMELAHAQTELDEVLREERAKHETSVGALEAHREALKQEKEELSTKVRLLEEERRLLQEGRECSAHELKALQEESLLAAKATADHQGEINILNSTVHGLQRELEERKLLEADARAEYAREIESLKSRLQEYQTKMDQFEDEHLIFERKLEHAVCQDFPEGVMRPPLSVVSSSLDYCWTMVSLILKGSSRKLEDLHMRLAETQNNLEEELRKTQVQHASSLQAIESSRELLMHEKEVAAQRVVFLVAKSEEAVRELDSQRVLFEERLREISTAKDVDNLMLRSEIDRLRKETEVAFVSKELDYGDLKKQIKEAMMGLTEKETEIQVLQEQVQSMTVELAKAKEEKSVAQSELVQSEKRLANTKERLTLAINKGKSIVQQRDAVKLALAEKARELDRVVSSHTQTMKLKDLALQEVEAKVFSLNATAERAVVLEADLAAAQNTAAGLEKSLSQIRSSLNELEGAVDRITTLPDEWKLKKGVAKMELVAKTLTNFQMRASYFESKAESLILELTTMSNERENIAQKLRDVTIHCDQFEKISAQDALRKAALQSEITRLQEAILAMEAEASRHTKLQQDVSIAMKLLDSSREVQQDSVPDMSISKPVTEVGLEAAIAHLIEKYTSAMHEVEELMQRTALLTEALAISERERNSCSDEKLQSFQEMLESRELEMTEANKRLEEAAIMMSQQDTEIQALVQGTQRLRDELVKSNAELLTLRSDLRMTENKVAALKEQLKSAIDPDWDSVPRDGNPKVGVVSMCEKFMELESLVVGIVERSHRREIELQDVHEKFMGMADTTSGLVLELDAAKRLHADLEHDMVEFKNVVAEVGWLEGGPPRTSSRAEWVAWLVDALQEEQQKVERAAQEVASLKRTAETFSFQVEGLRGKNESLRIELSYQEKENTAVAEEIQRRDMELRVMQERLLAMADNTSALELELDAAKTLGNDLEQAFSEFKAVVEEVSLPEGPSPTSFPAEWVSWLLQALLEEQHKASVAAQEAESLKRAADAASLEVEGVQGKYESLCAELSNMKGENEALVDRLRDMSEKCNLLTEQAIRDAAERISLKKEIQALENSHLELTSRDDTGFSEACRAVTGLQETLASRDQELHELHRKMEVTSFEFAQRNSDYQALLEERQRLRDKLKEIEGERDSSRVEAIKAAQWNTALQSDVMQAEQKLALAREKLNLAIKKGKGLEKRRDSLKQSLAEQTAKMENLALAHTQLVQSRDTKLQEARAELGAMEDRVRDLELELALVRERGIASEAWMEKQFQRLESALSQIEFSKDAVSEGPIEKIEWLGMLLKETRNTVVLLEREVEKGRDAVEALESKLRDASERAQSLVIENTQAQETISFWMKKVEEAENRAVSDRAQYENEIDAQAQALKEAQLRLHAVASQVERMDQLYSSLNASETARSKAVSRLVYTRNKLNELVQQSQELVGECEALHRSLQNRDAEIVELRRELTRLTSVGSEVNPQIALLKEELARVGEKADAEVKALRAEHVALQSALKEKNFELGQIQRQLEGMLGKVDNTVWMERNIVSANQNDGTFEEIDLHSTDGGAVLVATVSALQQRVEKLVVEEQSLRLKIGKKDAQVQKLRKEVDGLSMEKASLQAGLQAKQSQIERLQTELTTAIVPVGDSHMKQSEIDDVGPRRIWVGPGSSAAPHVRGARRLAQLDIAIDMDEEADQLLSDLDDKGHGYSSLTNSRLVPKATRVFADRVDGVCVAGGRLLMREPSARLGLAIYLIIIHVYMAMIFSRAIIP